MPINPALADLQAEWDREFDAFRRRMGDFISEHVMRAEAERLGLDPVMIEERIAECLAIGRAKDAAGIPRIADETLH